MFLVPPPVGPLICILEKYDIKLWQNKENQTIFLVAFRLRSTQRLDQGKKLPETL